MAAPPGKMHTTRAMDAHNSGHGCTQPPPIVARFPEIRLGCVHCLGKLCDTAVPLRVSAGTPFRAVIDVTFGGPALTAGTSRPIVDKVDQLDRDLAVWTEGSYIEVIGLLDRRRKHSGQ